MGRARGMCLCKRKRGVPGHVPAACCALYGLLHCPWRGVRGYLSRAARGTALPHCMQATVKAVCPLSYSLPTKKCVAVRGMED